MKKKKGHMLAVELICLINCSLVGSALALDAPDECDEFVFTL